jgi:hypothetical protein
MGGGGFTAAGLPMLCEGDAVKAELDRVFDPHSPTYATAQSAKGLFEGIGVGAGNWNDLLAAYKAAGVVVPTGSHWPYYLSTLTPADIQVIAQARFDGLTRAKKMKVHTHDPTKGGDHHVHVPPDAPGQPIIIDAPFMPDPGCP